MQQRTEKVVKFMEYLYEGKLRAIFKMVILASTFETSSEKMSLG